MHFEAAGNCKLLVTFAAAVWSFSCVHPHVYGEVTCLAKSLLAQLTLVRSLSGVNPEMRLEVPQAAEPFPTLGTAVRLLTSVDPLVYAEVARIAESFATVLAAVRPLAGVSPHVDFELVVLVEAFPTVRAAVGLLTSVDTLVYLELTGMSVRLTADVTAIRSFSCMGASVGSEKIGPSKMFTTVAADMDLSPAVSLDVNVEGSHLVKCFGACGTTQKVITILQKLFGRRSR